MPKRASEVFEGFLQSLKRCYKTGSSEPFKVTFARNLFFSGFKSQNKTARVVKAYVFCTAPEPLVSYRVLVTVLAFHLFHQNIFLLVSISRDYFLFCRDRHLG
jgi:hypothetical protein